MDLSILPDVAGHVVAAVQNAPTQQGANTSAFANLGAGIAIGAGAIGPGIGVGLSALGAQLALARNPEVLGDARILLIIGAALAESIAIYALLIAILLLFVVRT